jgi:murein hydrolase activator
MTALAVLLAAALAAAPAATAEPARPRVDELQKSYDDLAGRIDAARRSLAVKEDEERSLLGEMERLDRAISERTGKVALLREKERELARRVEESSRRAERLRQEEERQRARLEGRAVALYKYGQAVPAGLLLAGRAPDDRERRMFYLAAAARSDADLLRRARLLYEEQRQVEGELRERRAGLEQARGSLSDELAGLLDRKRDKTLLLAGIRGEKEGKTALLGEMEGAAGHLQGMIERMRREEDGESGFAAARGTLPLPVDGPVTGAFGRHRNPRFDTYTISRGITIKAAEGTPVRAVFRGKVLFADWFRGYGRIAIIDHGAGYYTLYGHLATLAVAAGDDVGAGLTVGHVGETGSLEGPALYFEVRHHGKPEDPKPWLAPGPKAGGSKKP